MVVNLHSNVALKCVGIFTHFDISLFIDILNLENSILDLRLI